VGEDSKRSGEIGETLAAALLAKIGWRASIHNVSIDCTTSTHVGQTGQPRRTHGEDRVFFYHNPFHDDRSDIVHISVKNHLGTYPTGNALKRLFKSNLKELCETIECAKHDPKLHEACRAFGTKRNKQHSGLLIWLQNDDSDIEANIKPTLKNVRLDYSTIPVYLIDNARASFLLKVVDDVAKQSEGDEYEFYFPKIGTALSEHVQRSAKALPVELIASDIIPVKIIGTQGQQLVLYADQAFSVDAYKKLIAYALHFASGWVSSIRIGMPDFNPARDEEPAATAKLAFSDRSEHIQPFCFDRSLLALLGERS
jgi:hypothetical protein